MKIIVIIPTYNERENLPILVERIFALKIPELSVLVVDDNSPDGTGEVAEELAKKYQGDPSINSGRNKIMVLHRSRKEGLGTAYTAGFQFLFSHPETKSKDLEILRGAYPEMHRRAQNDNAEYVIQMDADLSHDPAMIPKMFEMMQCSPSINSGAKNKYSPREVEGSPCCDLVLGSRYVSGGKIENWNWARRLVSRFGNLYARWILGLPYRDLTGGFKCYRRAVLEKMDLEKLSSTGYNFQIETTYRAHQLGFKICEVPITFTERKTGQSKFSLGIILESFWRVILLRFQK